MKTCVPLLLLAFAFPLQAKTVHLSTSLNVGPQWDTGISGVSGQLGLAEIYKTNSIYFSFGHTDYEYFIDHNKWNTYRIGVQHQLEHEEKIAFQFELGAIDYQGTRDYFFEKQHRSGTGVSTSAAVVFNFNSYIAVRTGLDINYIDSSRTFLPYSTFATINAGLVGQF